MQTLLNLQPRTDSYSFEGSGGMATYLKHFRNEINRYRSVTILETELFDSLLIGIESSPVVQPVRHFLDGFNVPSSYQKRTRYPKTFVTIHDLQDIYFPENFSSLELKKRENIYTYLQTEPANIIAISKQTQQDLVHHLGIEESRVRVIYHGVDHFSYKNIYENTLLEKTGSQKFFYIPGKGWKHKGQLQLVEAICQKIKEVRKLGVCFIFSCHPEDFGDSIQKILERYKAHDVIMFKSGMSDSQHHEVSQLSLGIILPSYFEGFGLSYAEALITNKAIFCFKLAPYLEIGTFNSRFAEFLDFTGLLQNALDYVADIEYLHKSEIDLSSVHSKFTWKNCVKQTLDYYGSAG